MSDPLAQARQYADITQVHVSRPGRRFFKRVISRVGRVSTYPQSLVNANLIEVVAGLDQQRNDVRDAVQASLDEVRLDVRALLDDVATTADLRAVVAEQTHLVRAIEALRADVAALRARVAEVELTIPEVVNASRPAPAPREDTPLPSEIADLYLDLEDAFRGSESNIRDRVRPYVPLLDGVVGRVVDLGCGRGELLDVCDEASVRAYGVDAAPANVERCRKAGHEVVEGDAVAHLATCGDGSLGGVTAIHLAEHLPAASLVELVRQAWRVLEPRGVLILETPNCENLNVGANRFWLDPTHQRPVHPLYLDFLARQFGFTDVEVRRIEREPAPVEIDDGDHDPLLRAVAGVLLSHFAVGSDVALIARR